MKVFQYIILGCCLPGMTFAQSSDQTKLSALNAKFIANFITMDTIAHNEIIHSDFVCIESSGAIVERKQYMKDWASDYQNGGYTSFSISDEKIRIFGNVALVRSRATYSSIKNGEKKSGHSVYTDTYFKENGRWRCIQAQITRISP
jgi:Domain of unknown function (DUF4440)